MMEEYKQPFGVRTKKGKRILTFLREELGIPDNIIRFKLIFDMEQPVKIEGLEYYPESDEE